jgi:hypothetical protein
MLGALRRIPVFKLVIAAELAVLAGHHVRRLTPTERRRLLELLRRPHRLSPAERGELRRLVAKLEPRAFAGTAAAKLSPVPLPKRRRRPETA